MSTVLQTIQSWDSGTWIALAAATSAMGSVYFARHTSLHERRNSDRQTEMLKEMVAQNQLALFDKYETQYTAIKRRLPHKFKDYPISETLDPDQEHAVSEMLVMFSGQHHLRKMGRVPDDFWDLWLRGMKSVGLAPHGDRIYRAMCNDGLDCDLPDDFIVFYNKLTDEERRMRQQIKANGYFPAKMVDSNQPIQIGGR